MNLHGRINFSRPFLDNDLGSAWHQNWLPAGYQRSFKQLIDARLGFALGRIEPFLGGLFSSKNSSPISVFRRGWQLGSETSLGFRGGLRFEIGDILSGGIVGSRKLDSVRGGANALEGSLRIKF